jgi:nucleoside-diphosphate-sugar epimerase
VSIKELVETIVEVYGNEVSIEWDKSKPNGDPIRLMNTERANKYGFFPKVELRDGIREVMKYYDEIYSISK